MSTKEDLQGQICNFIMGSVPQSALEKANENVRLGYAHADSFVNDHLKHISKSRLRAQMRRYMVDDGLADLDNEPKNAIRDTSPKGEHYIELLFGKVTLSHIEVHGNQKPRTALHRHMQAEKNKALEPYTPDLFDDSQEEVAETLHVVLLVVHPHPNDKHQSEPAEIFVAVPYTSWDGHHLMIPLAELLSMYSPIAEPQQPDAAWPKLKAAMQEKEKLSNDNE